MTPDRATPDRATPDRATPDLAAWWADILDVRPCGEDVFTAPPSPPVFPRVYGGHVAAQCLLAAAGTVDTGRRPHSAHTAFLRGGDARKPIDYRVTRVRDSRSLSTRLVLAEQDGRTLASATASFQVPGEVFDHGGGPPGPAPGPDSLPGRPDSLRARFGDDLPPGAPPVLPMDMRYVDQVRAAPRRATGSGPGPPSGCPTTRSPRRRRCSTSPTTRCSSRRCSRWAATGAR